VTFTTSYSKDNVVCCKHEVTLASLRLTAVFDLSGIMYTDDKLVCLRFWHWWHSRSLSGQVAAHAQT